MRYKVGFRNPIERRVKNTAEIHARLPCITSVIQTMTRPTTPSEDTIPSETSEFSFITLTGPMTDTKAISKRVRKHVMQDYVRKAKSKDAVTAVAVTPIPQLVTPANHKGKFKLDSWKRRNEAKVPPTSSSVAMQINQKNHLPISNQEVVQQPSTSSKGTSTHVLVRQRPTLEKISSHLFRRPSSFGLQFNPFDTVAISASDKLIWYCKFSPQLISIPIASSLTISQIKSPIP
jgi:hypothetical protein